MPRRKLFKSDWFPYHITARTNNGIPFPLPLERVWEICCFELWKLNIEYEIEIQAFVLMPNHFHLILTVPFWDVGRVMNLFMKNVAQAINRASGRRGHVFGGPYYWTSVQSARYFAHVLKYVYRNPVKGGLSSKVEDYPYSTLQGLIGESHLELPIRYPRAGLDHFLPGELVLDWLPWLNTPFSTEAHLLIQAGLRKKVFGKRIDPITRKPCVILEQAL